MKWINLANELIIALQTGDKRRQAELFAVMDRKKIQKQKRKIEKRKTSKELVLHDNIV